MVITGTLVFGTIALADIVSGLSTTNVSNDVVLTQLPLSKPASTAVGDILLANVSVNGGSPAGITAPTGWVFIVRSDNDANVSVASYYKVVTSSEPSTYTWIITPQNRAAGGITRYSGVDVTNPIDAFATSTGRGVTATAPSITTTFGKDRIVALFASDAGKNTDPLFTTSTGMDKKYDVKNGPFGPTTAAEDALLATAGATGPNTVTVSNHKDVDWAAQTIALKMQRSNAPSMHLQKSMQPYVVAPSSPSLAITGNLTIETWVKFDSLPATNEVNFIVNKADNTWAGNSYGFGLENINGTSVLFFGIVTNSQPTQGNVNWSPTTGTWYHVALAYDTAGNATFYVNGTSIGTITGLASSIQASNANFCIGSDCNGSGFFDGNIDEARLYNVTRTQSQIQSDYTQTLTGSESGLNAYWSFSNNLNDTTSNHNNLTNSAAQFSSDTPF